MGCPCERCRPVRSKNRKSLTAYKEAERKRWEAVAEELVRRAHDRPDSLFYDRGAGYAYAESARLIRERLGEGES